MRNTTAAVARYTIDPSYPVHTTPRPVRVYIYASQSADVQAKLAEYGIQLTETGENVWVMLPGV